MVAIDPLIDKLSPPNVDEKKILSILHIYLLLPTIAEIGIPLPIPFPIVAKSGVTLKNS